MSHRNFFQIFFLSVFLFASSAETAPAQAGRHGAKKAINAVKARPPAAVKRPAAVRPPAAVKPQAFKKPEALRRPDAISSPRLDSPQKNYKKNSVVDQVNALKKQQGPDKVQSTQRALPTSRAMAPTRMDSVRPMDAMGKPKYDELLAAKKLNLENARNNNTGAVKPLPKPETYLSQEYISNHNAKFDNGASRFVTKGNLGKYGPAQRDGTSFVVPAHDADKLIAETKGDKAALEKKLGLPEGTLSKDDLVRIDIPDPRKAGLRIPDGNEAGANEQWLPGGKLPDGGFEAVVDLGKGNEDKWTSTDLDFK